MDATGDGLDEFREAGYAVGAALGGWEEAEGAALDRFGTVVSDEWYAVREGWELGQRDALRELVREWL